MPIKSNPLMNRIRGVFHRVILLRISYWYRWIHQRFGIPIWTPAYPGVYVLPFNTLLKVGSRVREDEVHAIGLARSLGVPVPRVLSYGDDGPGMEGSIWMTIVPGVPANIWWQNASAEEHATYVDELNEYLSRMRRLPNPLGPSISSICGGPMKSHRAPDGVIPACASETEFVRYLMSARWPPMYTEEEFKADGEAILKLLTVEHDIVFTHGDLHFHNVIVKDGHISGIIDWECAGWMPEYWEFGVILRCFDTKSEWYRLVTAMPSFKYKMEMAADYVLAYTTDQSYPY